MIVSKIVRTTTTILTQLLPFLQFSTQQNSPQQNFSLKQVNIAAHQSLGLHRE